MYSATSRLALAMAMVFSGFLLFSSTQAQDLKPEFGPASLGAAPAFTGDASPQDGPRSFDSLAPSLIYAFNNTSDEFGTFDPPLSDSYTGIGAIPSADYCGAGATTPDGSLYYLICGTLLMEVDSETGAVTDTVGDLGTPDTFSGMNYDPASDTWYGSSSSELFTIDVDAATVESVGAFGADDFMIAIAFDANGDLYGHTFRQEGDPPSVIESEIVSIDKETAITTAIGGTGFTANFGQGMTWDYINETMYMTVINVDEGNQRQLRSVDLGTGMTTLEWVLPGQTDATAGPANGVAAPRPEDPTLVVSISEIDFGEVGTGEEADAVEVQLVNIGEPTLTISDIALDDGTMGFEVDLTGTNMTLETDEQTSFLVGFAPTEEGDLADNVTIASDDPASPATVALSGSARDAALDEPCALDEFTVVSPANGGSPVSLTCEGGVVSQGNVVGFHFIGDEAGSSGNSSWASDTCMIVEAPDGTTYNVGGISATDPACAVNDWEFQGGVSTEDGTYESTHDGVFDTVDDEGTWTFTFINDWNSTSAADMTWSDVTVTLRKVPSIATEASPDELADILGAPSPNPVRGMSTFAVAVENGQNVTVEVFDVTGRRIQTLYDATLASGMSETLTLDASALPAGVYVIRATGEDFVKTQRVTVVR